MISFKDITVNASTTGNNDNKSDKTPAQCYKNNKMSPAKSSAAVGMQ